MEVRPELHHLFGACKVLAPGEVSTSHRGASVPWTSRKERAFEKEPLRCSSMSSGISGLGTSSMWPPGC